MEEHEVFLTTHDDLNYPDFDNGIAHKKLVSVCKKYVTWTKKMIFRLWLSNL